MLPEALESHHRWRRVTSSYALLIEDKGSGMSLIQDLKGEGIRAIGVKPTTDKILRMNAHTAGIEAGYVYRPRRAPWLNDFQKEAMAFPAAKYDDQVDALTQFAEYMRRSQGAYLDTDPDTGRRIGRYRRGRPRRENRMLF